MKKIIATTTILLAVLLMASCKKDKDAEDANKALLNEVNAGGYSYYASGNLLSGVSPSPHGSFKLRLNATAQAALDGTGELPAGGSFPNGSIIVKEIFSGSSINLLAIMKKDASNSNAGSGWVWAEIKPNGDVTFGVEKKGDGCISCHSGNPNRDLTRTFDLH